MRIYVSCQKQFPGADFFSDVLGKSDYGRRTVTVVEIGHEHVVSALSEFTGPVLQFGAHSEDIWVQEHPRVLVAMAGKAANESASRSVVEIRKFLVAASRSLLRG